MLLLFVQLTAEEIIQLVETREKNDYIYAMLPVLSHVMLIPPSPSLNKPKKKNDICAGSFLLLFPPLSPLYLYIHSIRHYVGRL